MPASSGGRSRARPSTRSIRPRGSPPGRSSIGVLKAADNGGFDADRDRAAIDDQVDPSGKVACTWAAVVGETWPDKLADGATTGPPKARRMASGRRGWAGTRIATVSSPAVARSATAQSSVLGSTSVSGPGQNASRQRGRGCVEAGDPPGGFEIADMGDQRIEGRPALGLVEPGNGRRVGGVGAEPIDGLGRERDQPAFRQAARGRGHGGLIGRQNWRCQAHIHRGQILNSASCGVRNPRL